MKTLTFYHQKRKDGGIRTGVELNGERILELFKAGAQPPDSSLEWFVDVRARGPRLPDSPEAIREWLLDPAIGISRELRKMADELSAGIDPEWPFTKTLSTTPKGVSINVVCSAVRRLDCRQISKVLSALEKSWPRLVAVLPAFPSEMAA